MNINCIVCGCEGAIFNYQAHINIHKLQEDLHPSFLVHVSQRTGTYPRSDFVHHEPASSCGSLFLDVSPENFKTYFYTKDRVYRQYKILYKSIQRENLLYKLFLNMILFVCQRWFQKVVASFFYGSRSPVFLLLRKAWWFSLCGNLIYGSNGYQCFFFFLQFF